MRVFNLFLVLSIGISLSACAYQRNIGKEGPVLAVAKHHMVTKIVESNYAAVRPGSIYDIRTYFEQRAGWTRPEFNYVFNDTGLGVAEALYPVFQTGHQENWNQLVNAMADEENRHIDHFSVGETPEGCKVESVYWVRHVNEYPDKYLWEKANGFTLVDIGFDHYTRQKPDAHCGRHKSFEPNPDFNPAEELTKYADTFSSLSDIPPELLSKFEAKIGILRLVDEEFSSTKWPRFDDLYSFEKNSMWYYPNGHQKDFGIHTPTPQSPKGLEGLDVPEMLLVDATPGLQSSIRLSSVLEPSDFQKLLEFLNGKPTKDYDSATEPGADHFSLSQVVSGYNLYSYGAKVRPIENVVSDVSNIDHFKLASIIIRPYEEFIDESSGDTIIVPQLRFVFQLHDPENMIEPVEQLYLHVMFDGIDRMANSRDQRQQHLKFLKSWAALSKQKGSKSFESYLSNFVSEHTKRKVQALNFSSSLTGIWVFGSLSRGYNGLNNLEAVRIVRHSVDVGFYSTAHDNKLFSDKIKQLPKEEAEELTAYMKILTPEFYRDPRRMDVHNIGFNKVTCAQCHQMSGRDAVHVSLNDKIDPRIDFPTRTSEFTYRELQRQLEFGQTYWQ